MGLQVGRPEAQPGASSANAVDEQGEADTGDHAPSESLASCSTALGLTDLGFRVVATTKYKDS